jgi:hypothetical protein
MRSRISPPGKPKILFTPASFNVAAIVSAHDAIISSLYYIIFPLGFLASHVLVYPTRLTISTFFLPVQSFVHYGYPPSWQIPGLSVMHTLYLLLIDQMDSLSM